MTDVMKPADDLFTARLVESLYVEAMVLADEARSYFERDAGDQGLPDDQSVQIDMSCESLRVTTRLMHSIAWLLNQKAYFAGELSLHQLRGRSRALGSVTASNPQVVARLPLEAQLLVHDTQHLLDRLVRLERSIDASRLGLAEETAMRPAVLHLQSRLAAELTL